VVAAGTPEQVAAVKSSYTGQFLAGIVEPARRHERRRPAAAAA
jgi:excinuclease UvrABC ATPase subunit